MTAPEKPCEAWQGTPDDYILRSRCKVHDIALTECHAKAEIARLRAEVEELRKGLSRTQGELNEILAERNTIAKERDEARAALRNFVREHLEEIHDVSYEYCRLCIEARRILGEKP